MRFSETVKGKVWKFGDNLNTDVIFPSKYFSLDPDKVKRGLMKGIRKDFTDKIKAGDIIVGGKNFGCGSSREVSAKAVKLNGISTIIAESFARIFFRNMINNGILPLECEDITKNVNEGDTIEISLNDYKIRNLTTGKTFQAKPLNKIVMNILNAGGLIEKLKGE
jgi:3-isopropylmalate/(R)-2-methylmalate dehydratase small subunit